jgi:hypothetical protein
MSQKPFKFKFPDGRDPRAKKRALMLALSFIVLLTILSYSQDVNRPESCGLCHVMVPHVRTWQASAHNQTSCLTCHQETGIDGIIKFQVSLAEMAYNYVTEKYYLPIAMSDNMPADSCYSCHALNREMTPSGDLIVPHQAHEMVRVDCMSCHTGVVHANISYRQLTLAGDTKMWTPSFSKNQMSYQFRNLSMQACLDCHDLRRVDLSCRECHTDIDYPDTHYEDDFLLTHGHQAHADLLGCDRCHSWTRGKVDDPRAMLFGAYPARDYARNNKFCYRCHLERPDGHDEIWQATHAVEARNGREGCYVCHDFNRGVMDVQFEPRFSTIHCAQCHVRRHRGGLWKYRHPTDVWNKKLTSECLYCHSGNYCGRCHLIYQ